MPLAASESSLICEFCSKMGEDRSSRAWYDFNVLLEDDDVIAILGLGALSPGYLVVMPPRHVTSVAQLPDHEFERFRARCEGFASVLQEEFGGRVTIFEHGRCSEEPDLSGGACIDHAHWHLVPLPEPVRMQQATWLSVPDISCVKESLSITPYQYIMSDLGQHVRLGHAPSQLIRRIVAEHLGLADQWDYLAFPFLENMRETLERLNHGEALRVEQLISN